MTAQKRFREMLKRDRIIVAPGAYNALVARIVEDLGFEAVYATGAGLANSTLAFPDIGLISYKEMIDGIRYIVDSVDLPVIADADTGYGGPFNIVRTVREYEKAGVAALHIEDQVIPKRCGHFAGKEVVTVREMVERIKAAVDSRNNPDLVIIARTDARAVNGLEDAITRAQAYLEAGADMTFVEAPETLEELGTITRRLSAPQVANMVEGGKTPLVPASKLQEMGFKVVLYANLALRASVKACQHVLTHLRDHGSSEEVLDSIITMEERNRITRLPTFISMGEKYSS